MKVHQDLGDMLRDWRVKRHRSQLALALESGVSARHLSFIETGRSRPSPDVILALAEQLAIPLRVQNDLLQAGGYAPRFSETPLAAPDLAAVRDAMQRLLHAHDPYPGVALDREWNVVLANRAAQRMVALLPAHLTSPSLNMFRASLHPAGFAAITTNFAAWGSYLVTELERLVASSADVRLAALFEEVSAYPNVRTLMRRGASSRSTSSRATSSRSDTSHPAMEDGASAHQATPALLVPCELVLHGVPLSMFTTLATLGSPRDITLAELTVELFYPSDERTAAALRSAELPSAELRSAAVDSSV